MITQKEMICIGCQECCKWITFTISVEDKKRHKFLCDFYKARGIQVVEHSNSIEVMIETICPHLTKYGCNIYGERPEACRIYDGRKDPLMKDFCKLDRNKKYA